MLCRASCGESMSVAMVQRPALGRQMTGAARQQNGQISQCAPAAAVRSRGGNPLQRAHNTASGPRTVPSSCAIIAQEKLLRPVCGFSRDDQVSSHVGSGSEMHSGVPLPRPNECTSVKTIVTVS